VKEARNGNGGAAPPPALWRRQWPLLLIVPTALVVMTASSWVARGLVLPLLWDWTFVLNPVVVLLYLLYGGIGLLIFTGSGDRGWPLYFGLVFLWIFAIAFVDMSIIQWFELQMGAITGGRRVNPVMMFSAAVAIAATILLHVNQLARRLHESLRARGVDAAELTVLEEESRREGQRLVSLLVGFAAIIAAVLWVGDFIFGRARLGLNVLGILSGLVLVSFFLVLVNRLLSRGPLDLDAATAGVVSAHEVPPDPLQDGMPRRP
jgi:hypothetical protein